MGNTNITTLGMPNIQRPRSTMLGRPPSGFMPGSFGMDEPTAPIAPTWPMGGGQPPSGMMPHMLPQVPPTAPQRPLGPPMGSRIGQSQFNRGYAPGSLAGRGATPVGRSMKDAPERRLETAARYGDLRAASKLVELKQAGMQRDFLREQNQVNFDQSKEMYGMQQQDLAAHDAEQRRQRMEDFTREEQLRNQQQPQQPQTAPRAAVPPSAGSGAGVFDSSWIPSLPWDGKGPLPPSVLEPGGHVPGPPAVDSAPIPNTNGMMVMTNGRPTGQTFSRTDSSQNTAVPKPEEITKHIQDMQKGGVQAQYGKGGWTYAPHATKQDTVKVVNELGKVVDFPADHEIPDGWTALKKRGDAGAVPAAQSAGGGAAAGKPVEFTSPGGVQVKLKPQASTQTGQMPNEAYANDLTPEQSLASAHADYLKTGNDAALRKHFQSFPSQAMQYINEAQQIYNNAGSPGWPNTQEASQRMNRLMAQAAAARQGQHVASWDEDPERVASPPKPSQVQQPARHPLHVMADSFDQAVKDAKSLGGYASGLPNEVATYAQQKMKEMRDYASKNPLVQITKS